MMPPRADYDAIPYACSLYSVESIRQARRERCVVNVLTVYGDESHDETKQRVFVVSGVMGSADEWSAFGDTWLERTGGKAFHAADCENGRGEYEGIDRKENLGLYADLIRKLCDSPLLGFSVALNIQALNEFFPPPKLKKPTRHIHYHACFKRVIVEFANLARYYIPPDVVEFIFDHNHETDFSAGILYDYMTRLPKDQWKDVSQVAERVSFAIGKKPIGVQVADLLAREIMKQIDKLITGHTPWSRLSFQALRKSDKFPFEYLDRHYFKEYKKNFRSIQEKSGLTWNLYEDWLKEHKRVHNNANLHMFMIDWASRRYQTSRRRD